MERNEISADSPDGQFLSELQALIHQHLGPVNASVMVCLLSQAGGSMAAVAVSMGELDEDVVPALRNRNFEFGQSQQSARIDQHKLPGQGVN